MEQLDYQKKIVQQDSIRQELIDIGLDSTFAFENQQKLSYKAFRQYFIDIKGNNQKQGKRLTWKVELTFQEWKKKANIEDGEATTQIMNSQIDTLNREINLILNKLTEKNYEKLKKQLVNDFFLAQVTQVKEYSYKLNQLSQLVKKAINNLENRKLKIKEYFDSQQCNLQEMEEFILQIDKKIEKFKQYEKNNDEYFKDLQIRNLNITDQTAYRAKISEIVTDRIIDKAKKEENFNFLYAQLVASLNKEIRANLNSDINDKAKEDKKDFNSIFKNKLSSMVDSFNYHEVSQDWKDLTLIEKFNFEEQWKKSLKLLMRFCGNLFLNKVLVDKVIKSILGTLIIKFIESYGQQKSEIDCFLPGPSYWIKAILDLLEDKNNQLLYQVNNKLIDKEQESKKQISQEDARYIQEGFDQIMKMIEEKTQNKSFEIEGKLVQWRKRITNIKLNQVHDFLRNLVGAEKKNKELQIEFLDSREKILIGNYLEKLDKQGYLQIQGLIPKTVPVILSVPKPKPLFDYDQIQIWVKQVNEQLKTGGQQKELIKEIQTIFEQSYKIKSSQQLQILVLVNIYCTRQINSQTQEIFEQMFIQFLESFNQIQNTLVLVMENWIEIAQNLESDDKFVIPRTAQLINLLQDKFKFDLSKVDKDLGNDKYEIEEYFEFIIEVIVQIQEIQKKKKEDFVETNPQILGHIYKFSKFHNEANCILDNKLH